MENSDELMRIHQAISKDFDKWDGEQPIEEFITDVLQKRLFLEKEKVEEISAQLIKGIVDYKKTKIKIEEDPESVKKIVDAVGKEKIEEYIGEAVELFKSVREGGVKNE